MLPIVRYRFVWFGISIALFLAGAVFLIIGGLRLGTDFTGGSLIQVKFTDGPAPVISDVETVLADSNLSGSRVQSVGESSLDIRSRQLSAEEHGSVLESLKKQYGALEEVAYSEVGPTLGKELKQKAIAAVILVLLGIIIYVSWAFRKSSGKLSGWAFGINALIALTHDVFITLGFFAMLGYFFHVEIDALFVTALMTVLGFSVHDTIVVFDRIREGIRKSADEPLALIIDRSVNETLVRSINTSLTALLVLFALYFFGGPTIKHFVLALIIGITIGTYSSIFLASPLLIYWKKSR